MKWTPYQAVITTLLYAQLFEYPLTLYEVWLWCVSANQMQQSKLQHILQNVSQRKNFYGLKNLQKHITLREKRHAFSLKKHRLVPDIIRFLSIIPSIELIGISGGLAMNNAKFEDDIDLFFIVRPKTIWVSRLFILFILELLGKRRKFNNEDEKDRFCANMFVVSTHLTLPENEQDIYSAHEVLQMMPVFERNNTYKRFLEKNSWVKNYLANAWQKKTQDVRFKNQIKEKKAIYINVFDFLFLIPYYLLEVPAKYIQLWYMRSHKTTEIISDIVLRFHPNDTRQYVRQKYVKLLRQYKIPLDSMFFKSLQ